MITKRGGRGKKFSAREGNTENFEFFFIRAFIIIIILKRLIFCPRGKKIKVVNFRSLGREWASHPKRGEVSPPSPPLAHV